jgi:hypothetical protein
MKPRDAAPLSQPHPPLNQETDMTQPVQGPAYYFPSIEKKYGRPISEWIDLIRSCKLAKHKELVDWLKTEYGIGHGHATALVGYTLAGTAPGSACSAG